MESIFETGVLIKSEKECVVLLQRKWRLSRCVSHHNRPTTRRTGRMNTHKYIITDIVQECEDFKALPGWFLAFNMYYYTLLLNLRTMSCGSPVDHSAVNGYSTYFCHVVTLRNVLGIGNRFWNVIDMGFRWECDWGVDKLSRTMRKTNDTSSRISVKSSAVCLFCNYLVSLILAGK